MQTRWHEDDLIGRLARPDKPTFYARRSGKWKIINLPAIAEENDPLKRKPGELLWPERFDTDFMEAQRRLDSRGFTALYQQRPTPEDGDLFARKPSVLQKKTNLKTTDYAASDHAVGVDKTRNDASCLMIVWR